MSIAITARRNSCSTAPFPPHPARLAKSARPRPICVTAAGRTQQEALDRFGIKRPLRYLLFPGTVQNALSPNWFGKTGPEHSGLYKVRIQASGIRPPGGQPAHLSIGKRTGEETVDGLIEFDLTAPEDSPQVYEFEVFLEMPATLDFCVVATDVVDRGAGAAFRNALASRGGYIFTHSSETLLLNPNAPQMFDDKGNGLFSTVLLDWIEWEGPLETDAEKSRRKGLVPPDDATPEVVAEHLQRFAERAWRRPVKQGGTGGVSAILPRRTRGGRKDGRRLSGGDAGRADLPATSSTSSRATRWPASVSTTGNSPRGSRISSGVRCRTTASSPRPKAAP